MKFALLSAGVLALALSVPAIAAQPPVPADGLVLQGSNPKKPVTFNHSTHKTVECVICHHPVDGKESYAKCATAGCHDNLKDKKGTNSLYQGKGRCSPEASELPVLSRQGRGRKA